MGGFVLHSQRHASRAHTSRLVQLTAVALTSAVLPSLSNAVEAWDGHIHQSVIDKAGSRHGLSSIGRVSVDAAGHVGILQTHDDTTTITASNAPDAPATSHTSDVQTTSNTPDAQTTSNAPDAQTTTNAPAPPATVAALSNYVSWYPLNAHHDGISINSTHGEQAEQDPNVNHTVSWFSFGVQHLHQMAADLHSARMDAHLSFLNDEPNCTILIGEDQGGSDGADHDSPCLACQQNCSNDVQQPPVLASWDFTPTLEVLNAFDIKTHIVLESVSSIRPFKDMGIYHKMEFQISRTGGRGFWGQMGPMVMGGVAEAEGPLNGRHVFHLSDTEVPKVDRSWVKGRRLALPGNSKSGDIGKCVRTCLGCDSDHGHADLLALNLTTGVSCTIDNFAVDDGQSLVYRIYMSNPKAEVRYGGTNWLGAEWEVTVTDVLSGSHYVLGRVILESNSDAHGIKHWIHKHVHLGCSPCDAAYEAYRITGPFIQVPKGQHRIVNGRAHHMPGSGGQNCTARRTVATGGLEVLFESGPGVQPVPEASEDGAARLFSCG